MPALSYCKKNIEAYDFKNKIITGIKKHTIRRYGPGLRKRPFRVGDTLYHYENWRQPTVNKFHENTCSWVGDFLFEVINGKGRIKIDGVIQGGWYLCALATNDGFENFQQFKDFFKTVGLPFHGQIIGWEEVNYESI